MITQGGFGSSTCFESELRRQAIIWKNVDKILWQHDILLGQSDFKYIYFDFTQ